nr:GAF domain-containing protein [Streptomyces sp. SID8379]
MVEVSITAQPERTVVRVAGQLDHRAALALRRQLWRLADRADCLVLDLGRVSFLGFAGVALVEDVAEQTRSSGGELEVWGADDPRLRELHLNGALRALRINQASGEQGRNGMVLREALTAALRVAGAPMGNVQFLDPASGSLHITAQRGFRHPFLSHFQRVELTGHGSSCGAAAQRQSSVFVPDVRTSPLFTGTAAESVLEDAGVHAVASLPVVTPAGRLVGMVSTHRAEPTEWAPDVRHELEYVVRTAGQLTR